MGRGPDRPREPSFDELEVDELEILEDRADDVPLPPPITDPVEDGSSVEPSRRPPPLPLAEDGWRGRVSPRSLVGAAPILADAEVRGLRPPGPPAEPVPVARPETQPRLPALAPDPPSDRWPGTGTVAADSGTPVAPKVAVGGARGVRAAGAALGLAVLMGLGMAFGLGRGTDPARDGDPIVEVPVAAAPARAASGPPAPAHVRPPTPASPGSPRASSIPWCAASGAGVVDGRSVAACGLIPASLGPIAMAPVPPEAEAETRSRRDRRRREAAPPPGPEPARATPSGLLREARAALSDGDPRRAHALAARSHTARPSDAAASVLVRASCQMGHRDRARSELRDVPLLERGRLRRTCRRRGVRLGL